MKSSSTGDGDAAHIDLDDAIKAYQEAIAGRNLATDPRLKAAFSEAAATVRKIWAKYYGYDNLHELASGDGEDFDEENE
jgi:hypothetical protein